MHEEYKRWWCIEGSWEIGFIRWKKIVIIVGLIVLLLTLVSCSPCFENSQCYQDSKGGCAYSSSPDSKLSSIILVFAKNL